MAPSSPGPRCSAITRDLSEPTFGTAPTSGAWILLEHPGPWGPRALEDSYLDTQFSDELERRAQEYGFKVLLIRRRIGKSARKPRTCFFARSAQNGTWIERAELNSAADLLDMNLDVFGSDLTPGLGYPSDPVWAVCTHGKRDPCCAEYGMKIVKRLAKADSRQIRDGLWGSSHQGGHRFAANLALFPHGLFYGQLDESRSVETIEAYLEGRLPLKGFRGRSVFDDITQAADYLIRDRDGLTRIDDLVPVKRRKVSGGVYEVEFEGPSSKPVSITIEISEGELRPESCNKPKLTPIRLYKEAATA